MLVSMGFTNAWEVDGWLWSRPIYFLFYLMTPQCERIQRTAPENPSLGWPSPCFCLSSEKGHRSYDHLPSDLD